MFSAVTRPKAFLRVLTSINGPWGFAGRMVLQALQVIVAPIPGEGTGLGEDFFTTRFGERYSPPSDSPLVPMWLSHLGGFSEGRW